MTPDDFAVRIGKSRDWVLRNYRDIPHRRIGQSVRFREKTRPECATD